MKKNTKFVTIRDPLLEWLEKGIVYGSIFFFIFFYINLNGIGMPVIVSCHQETYCIDPIDNSTIMPNTTIYYFYHPENLLTPGLGGGTFEAITDKQLGEYKQFFYKGSIFVIGFLAILSILIYRNRKGMIKRLKKWFLEGVKE